jgi:hypothetical protein
VRHDIDFSKLAGSFEMLWGVINNLTFYVWHYPHQVTAASCLFLAAMRFLTWFRK